jgi:hypothetical protein
MTYKVTARRSGDQVVFFVEASDTKEAYQKAKQEANRIFDYKPGDIGAPAVSVTPVPNEEE